MANEGEFPKANGDIYYAEDANITFYQALNSNIMNYGAVTIPTTTATIIKAANSKRKVILIKNNGTNSLYIGTSGVTTTNGQKILPKQSIKLFTKDNIYGVAETSSIDIRYLEVE